MENKKQNNNVLKGGLLLLTLLLAVSGFYIYKTTNDAKAVELLMESEKTTLMNQLMAANDSLSLAIESNTTLSTELMIEKDKIQELMASIENDERGDLATLIKYKKDVESLRQKVSGLVLQVTTLKNVNQKLGTKIDSTNVVLKETKTYNDTLLSQNDVLSKKIEKGAKIAVLNLQVKGIRLKGSGKEIDTDKASKTEVLKISFMIAENQIAKSGDKQYYVQIIDSKNNVVGEKKTMNFDDKVLTYSFIAAVKYENKTVKIEKNLAVKNLQKGSYFVNIFDKTDLVSKANFTLN